MSMRIERGNLFKESLIRFNLSSVLQKLCSTGERAFYIRLGIIKINKQLICNKKICKFFEIVAYLRVFNCLRVNSYQKSSTTIYNSTRWDEVCGNKKKIREAENCTIYISIEISIYSIPQRLWCFFLMKEMLISQ